MIRQRDLEWKKELEERDGMLRVKLKERDEEYWKGKKKGMTVCQECWKEGIKQSKFFWVLGIKSG